MITGKYPELRLRRSRKNDWSRRLIEENNLTSNDFILPIFLIDGKNKKQEIKSMPGVYRYTLDKVLYVIDKAVKKKLPMVALFPYTKIKKIGNIKSLGDRLFSSINLLDQSLFRLRLSLKLGNLPVIILNYIYYMRQMLYTNITEKRY